ncbi:DUF5681 domain-containing protein [Bosea sp. (in: a-proteobacteria)]|uniref:DUF5681 domain-containing protein n=1 Tax=Bosea sp. (in: a-proteobacteria) TaxID=1871050 RepID=UPI002B4A2942|nr:DUF5681 domain-containing protein [Bosea sp. (in: a-proteobacteria)]WRH56684.1 MAG: hypothetical protein RSE11_16780 [Bosea sp. (in: a-proteobacteria)]
MSNPSRKSATNTRGRPFAPGNGGKPKGARHKTTLAIEALLDGEAETLTRKAIELAKAGDMQALRLCMDRLAPPRRDRSISFEMPSIETVDDLPAATRAIMDAVSIGDITPSEAAELGKLVDAHVRAIEVSDINKRLEALERTAS